MIQDVLIALGWTFLCEWAKPVKWDFVSGAQETGYQYEIVINDTLYRLCHFPESHEVHIYTLIDEPITIFEGIVKTKNELINTFKKLNIGYGRFTIN